MSSRIKSSGSSDAFLYIWWSLLWRFAILFALSLCGLFLMVVLLHRTYSVAGNNLLLVFSIGLVVISAAISFRVLKTVVGRPLHESVLVVLPLNVYISLLPGDCCYLVCKYTKWSEPYRVNMNYLDGTSFKALQLNSRRHLYTIVDSEDVEVAYCYQSALLGEPRNRFVIETTSGDQPLVVFTTPLTSSKVVLQVGDKEEALDYTRADCDVTMLGASLSFRWNGVAVLFNRDINKLSDHLFAAIVFFILLQRNKVGGS